MEMNHFQKNLKILKCLFGEMILIIKIFNETIAYPNLTPLIEKYLDITQMSVMVKGKHIDLEDIDNPIKPYSEVYFESRLIKYELKTFTTKISRQEVVLEDNIWVSLASPSPIVFNRFAEPAMIFPSGKTYYVSESQVLRAPVLMRFTINMDPNIYQHRRKIR